LVCCLSPCGIFEEQTVPQGLASYPAQSLYRVKSTIGSSLYFWALVTAQKPGNRPAKADRHTNHGVLLGYGASTKHVHYFDQTTNDEKPDTHHTIDEAHYIKTRHPPGPHIIMDMGYGHKPVLPAIATPPPLSRYLLFSRHNTATPFLCKLLTLPMNEFNSAPFAVITSVTTSAIDHNNSVTVTFSTDPFGPSFPETILVSGIHPTLGLDLHYDVDRHHCQLVNMAPGTPSHRLSKWKSRLRSAYILLGSWPLEIVIRWGKPYLARLDEYPRKPKYPAM
jgi:hypothetical protein